MKRRDFLKLLGTGTAALAATGMGCTPKSAKKPNIIFILADDLGYGDLSCFGQKHFQTPNIDKMAAEGLKFTDHYSGSTVCAPSRSCIMTGHHTGHTPIRGNTEIKPEGQHPMPADTVTIGKILQKAGYKTGAFGKWGLGFPGSEGDPNNQGFDEFFGYNCQRYGHNYYPRHMWHNQEKVLLKENDGNKTGIYGPNLIHEKTLTFIEQNKDNPFFLFVPSIIPHAELYAPEEYMVKYRGKFLPEKVYKGVDSGENFREGPYGSQPEAHAAFAAMIHLLDDQVGEIIDKVKELGLEDNTLILFSTDNGPHKEGGADPDYYDSNGPLKGYKRDLYEGGIRVPLIARWPNKIAAGTETNHVSAFWDLLPTCCELSGTKAPTDIDGISYLPTLFKSGEQKQHSHLYWEFHERGGRQAIRKGDWKAVLLNVKNDPNAPIELYNLKDDIGEENNLADQYPDIVKEIAKLMIESRGDSPVFKFSATAYNAEK